MAVTSRLAQVKDLRRQRLAALLDEYGQTELGRLTGIDQTYLWQMGKGEGKSRRGISDDNAAKIERGIDKWPGWMDGAEPEPRAPVFLESTEWEEPVSPVSQSTRPDPAILAQTQEFLETAFAFQGKAFDLRTDADLFADAYEWLAEDERPVDQRNLVHFGRWLAARQQAEEAVDEDESGRTTGKAAGTHRGRAARTA